MTDKTKIEPEPQCTDTCERCIYIYIYIEEGDFICDINNDVTIVGWKPFSCSCPKKKKRRNSNG